jgi:hypothetical protein
MWRGLNGKTWPIVVAVGAFLIVGISDVALDRTAIDVGVGRLIPDVAKRGTALDAAYTGIVWYRVWPSVITQYFECLVKDASSGSTYKMRFDLPQRIVPIPSGPGPLPPKRRPIGNQQDVPTPVPQACEPGLLHYGGYITVHTRFGIGPLSFEWPLNYDLPPNMNAEIQP